MKYFTPERYVALQDFSSDEVMNAADTRWEEAVEHYAAYLDTVRQHFPPGLRQIEKCYYLHDSIIRGVGKSGHAFVIILQLDTPPQPLLTFAYDLVEDPVIIKDALPADPRHAAAVRKLCSANATDPKDATIWRIARSVYV